VKPSSILPKSTRRQRERNTHCLEILAAAERIFAKKGLERATMEEVARASAFSVGTLYNFFKGKDDLLAQVLQKVLYDLKERLENEALRSDLDPFAALQQLIRVQLDELLAHSCFMKVLISLDKEVPPALAKKLKQRIHAYHLWYVQHVGALFERAMKTGKIRRMNASHAVLVFRGIIHGYWMQECCHGQNKLAYANGDRIIWNDIFWPLFGEKAK
jgi:AcrR family transcriptional regulator